MVIFIKKTDRDEKYVGWKMIFYFFLGTFTFHLQDWVLPVGIVLFLLYFLPKLSQNKTAKKWAASLGVVSFLSGIVITHSVNAYYERDLSVKASSANAFEMNFFKDYEKIKGALNAKGDLVITNLELSFNKSGKIQEYNYNALYEKDGKNMTAWVQQVKGTFKVFPSIQQENESAMVLEGMNYISSPSIYFHVLDQTGLKKMIPKGDFYHVAFASSEEFSPDQEKAKLWDIQITGIKEHTIDAAAHGDGKEEEYEPGMPYQISITTMKGTQDTGYTGDRYDYYTISPDMYE
jgi:hypothetical protein